MAMEALHAEQLSAAPTFKTRVVDVENISFTLHEKTSQEQSAASFAMQHRALPATDMTGLRLWNCSLCLVQCLMSPTELPHMSTKLGRPLRIVELGAGTGLLGLAVANRLERSSEVVLTDPDVAIGGGRTSLDVLRANIEANVAKSPSAAAAKLLWGSAHDIAALVDRYGVFDVAVGSELLYCEDSVAALAETVVELGVAMCVLAQQTRPAGNVAIEEVSRRRSYGSWKTAAMYHPSNKSRGLQLLFIVLSVLVLARKAKAQRLQIYRQVYSSQRPQYGQLYTLTTFPRITN